MDASSQRGSPESVGGGISPLSQGHQDRNNVNSNAVTLIPSTSSQGMNYARATRSDVFPKRDQAIVLQAIDGVPVKDYVSELVKATSPETIRFISRISNGRICVYLSTKQIADDLIDNTKTITIGNTGIPIKSLASRTKRLIMSNVCPEIPHELIEEKLKDAGIRIESKVTFIRAGISEAGLSHIYSFRRQAYIHSDDANEIPESMFISFDNLNFRIFLTADGLACFTCKNQGHLARDCPTAQHKNSPISTPNSSIDSLNSQPAHTPDNTQLELGTLENKGRVIDESMQVQADESKQTLALQENVNKAKRPLSISTTTNSIKSTYNSSDSNSSIVSLTEMDEHKKAGDSEPFKIPKKNIQKSIKETKN